MHKTFIKALTWNSSSTFFYKMSLLVHQIALYSVLSKTNYGLQSSLFAFIYTIIAITNFGLEESILTFFPSFSSEKAQFQKLLSMLSHHAATLLCITTLTYALLLHGPGEFLHNVQTYCNKNLIFILMCIFFIEATKKTYTTILQLGLFHKQLAYGQIGMISTYIGILWSWYALTKTMTMYTIFIPMLISSAAELCYISYNVANFYKTLPIKGDNTSTPLRHFGWQRCYNYINQITKALYSPNMMTLWLAYYIGFQVAATLKLYTTIITLIYACLIKIIGVSSGVTFSAMRSLSCEQSQAFFYKITRHYFQLLFILTCLIIIIVCYAWHQEWINIQMTYYILGFFIINLFENWSLTYEQFFITHGQTFYITLINSINLCIIAITIYLYTTNFTPVHQAVLISLFIMYKIITLIYFMWLIQHRKNYMYNK